MDETVMSDGSVSAPGVVIGGLILCAFVCVCVCVCVCSHTHTHTHSHTHTQDWTASSTNWVRMARSYGPLQLKDRYEEV